MDKTDAADVDALLAAQKLDQAVAALLTASIAAPHDAEPSRRLGLLLGTMGRMTEARVAFQRALHADANDLGALWGLYEVEQVLGHPEAAVAAEERAIALAPVVTVASAVTTPYSGGSSAVVPRVSVLMLCVAGTFQANTPLEYIANPERIALHKWYLTGSEQPELPAYDVIFNAIGHAHGLEPRFDEARAFIEAQAAPAINAPAEVERLARERLALTFANSKYVAVVDAKPVSREEIAAVAIDAPMLIRPLGSQAGDDLAKIESTEELQTYLAKLPGVETFYRAPFIDYRNNDGYFRKHRILFVDGVPYPVHLAISPRWMIHYYNAPMAENAWMRAEEERFMRDLSSVYDGPRAAGLAEIADRIPLEYFAIDCSIAPDGRVLLFEADTAMLVHLGDPIDLYPYKHTYIPRIITAIDTMFTQRMA